MTQPVTPAAARARRIPEWVWVVGFVLLVYVPILLTDPGQVEADTKSYLYFDPGRLLARVGSVWDPSFGMGTLTHQTIGYLFPMGPWFWFFEQVLGLPAWVAQRLWLGTIILAAGLGMRYLLRTFEVRGAGVPIGMLAYAFSPYVLGYAGYYSLLLGPWAALPWWIAFVALGLRRGGWKYPALFALTVQLVGSLNGSALIFAMIGPALWILYAVFVTREATWRRAWTVVWRIGLLTVLTSLWWVSALMVEGRYGVNILRFTESLETVSATSYPFEILRGLGYWFFYGGDVIGVWNEARPDYTQRALILFASLAIPTLALLSAGLLRWRERAYFVLVTVVGVVIAVGAAPYDDPSALGSLFKSFALGSKTGFALRNSNRAVPLVVLGLTVLLAVGVSAGVTALRDRGRPRLGVALAGTVAFLCLLNATPALAGGYFNDYLERDEEIPGYWQQAIAALDAKPNDTRVLALPGADFSSYRWGDTRDPVEPGFMDRPYVARELVPWGSEQSAAFLMALDRRLQEGAFEPDALAPVARLMGVGDVVLRMDLQTDRWSLIPAGQLWKAFTDEPPAGIGAPRRYGSEIPGKLKYPEIGDLSRPDLTDPDPPPVAILPVEDAMSIVRAKPTGAPIVIDGDGEGVMDVSAAGLLDADRLVLYSPAYEKEPAKLRELPDDALLVLTDSNRRRGLRWSGLHDRYGYTEQAGEDPLVEDPLDQRLEVFPDATDTSRTVAVLDGVRSIGATTYGAAKIGYSPGQRPAAAFDGDKKTGWLVDAGLPVGPERIRIELEEPVTTDRIGFLQPSKAADELTKRQNRYVSEVSIRFDDGPWVQRAMPAASRTKRGGEVSFPRRTFSTVEIRIDDIGGTDPIAAVAKNPVGFNEITIRDDAPGSRPVRVREAMLMPRDMLDALGARSATHPLRIVMSRESTMDQEAVRRQFELPTARELSVTGTATLSGFAKDDEIDTTFHVPGAAEGGVTATSNARHGHPLTRASSAIDGDATTAWVTPTGFVRARMRFRTAEPITVDRLDLQVVADGRHSLPTRLRLRTETGETRVVDVPPLPTDVGPGGVATVPVTFPALTGKDLRVSVKEVRKVKSGNQVLPVGIAELGLAGVRQPPLPAALPDECVDDLLEIDGRSFPVRVRGSTAEALDGQALPVEPCDPAATLQLEAGRHEVVVHVAPGTSRAIDIGRLVLSSAPEPAAATVPADAAGNQGRDAAPSEPRVRILDEGRTKTRLRVDGATSDFWLVLGQSFNEGWVAKADGVDLGPPELVDGYANGWRVPAARDGKPIAVTLEWEPQRIVWVACLISLAAGIACLGVILVAWLRRRRRRSAPGSDVGPGTAAVSGPREAAPTGRVEVVVAVGLSAVVSGLVVVPWVGLLVGGLTWLALARPRWRLALRFGPAAILTFVTLYMAIAQFFRHYPARFDWASFYEGLRIPTWIAVLLLGADALIELVGRARRPEPAADEPSTEAVGVGEEG